MDIQQMKYFLKLAENLNYTNTARELNLSVSSLSRQIVAIETELNVQLFFRDNKNVRLTTCGEYFKNRLSDIYRDYQQTIQNTQRIYQGISGHISCGILDDITLNGVMQENFYDFTRKHPDCAVDLSRGSFGQLLEGLKKGTYDCIISYFFALDHIISLKYKVIEDMKEGILISSKNPLSDEPCFWPEKFKNQTFIIVSGDDNDYAFGGPVQFCQKYGFYPKIRTVPDIDTATLLVEAGLGVSFTYEKSIGSYNPALKFLPLKEDEIMTSAPFVVLAWSENINNPAAESFIEEFRGKWG